MLPPNSCKKKTFNSFSIEKVLKKKHPDKWQQSLGRKGEQKIIYCGISTNRTEAAHQGVSES